MKTLITGAAGFIGYHLSRKLLEAGTEVIGVDNLNNYYSPLLKQDRLHRLMDYKLFNFQKMDLKNGQAVLALFKDLQPQVVINLAAQAGVRYSIENPQAYIDANIIGFFNILEACRYYPVKHLIYASSSSVYGGNKVTPYCTSQNVDHPVSLYAATKKSNELMAHTYSHLFGIPTTGLRFFTVYGPWGRPDMAYFSFTKDIIAGNPIKVFNHGKMERDFTYIDDIVEGLIRLIEKIPQKNDNWNEKDHSISESFAPYRIFNIGNHSPVRLTEFIEILERKLGISAKKIFLDMQAGDVLKTHADVQDLEKEIAFKPSTALETGLGLFIDWYCDYYKS